MPKAKVKNSLLPAPDARSLLRWYDRHRRDLPWRAKPGKRPDPYHVWLSEIMLQQTTVPTVGRYYREFTARWPSIHDLAAADIDDVMTAWAGLGYYRRARLLHECARIVVSEYGGKFPADEAALRRLPGIGAYTSAAIAAIAFGKRANVIDGNVDRIMARLYRLSQPIQKMKAEIRNKAAELLPSARHGDYAQALMDLGATVCKPRNPNCQACPWRKSCGAYAAGEVDRFPVQGKRKVKPVRRAIMFWLMDRQGRVWVRRRPPDGLLGGMMEIPSSPWLEQPMPELASVRSVAPGRANWRLLPGEIRHTFTHFDLYIKVAVARGAMAGADGMWADRTKMARLAMPSIMKKVIVWAEARGEAG
ncbi:MAG: A/G-specific adenine glycosylase [Alphaproteobacteria bacterium]